MEAFPIARRELLVASRGWRIYWERLAVAFAAAAVAFWILCNFDPDVEAVDKGRALFSAIGIAGFLLSVISGFVACDFISAEKREGTLGLLFLTKLKPHEVALGKVAALAMGAAFSVASMVPVMAIALFFGGFTLLDVERVALVWGCMLFNSLGIGITLSCAGRDPRRITRATMMLLLLVTLGPCLPDFVLNGAYLPQGLQTTHFGPLYALSVAIDARRNAFVTNLIPNRDFGLSLLLPCLGVGLAILTGCEMLRKEVRESGQPSRASRFLMRWKGLFSRKAGRRTASRAVLLDASPYVWLHCRKAQRGFLVWMFVAVVGVCVFRMCLIEPPLFENWHDWMTLVLAVHFCLKLWWAVESTGPLAQARQNGALELILTTPFSVQQIVEGHWQSLRRIFFKPLACLLAIEAVMTAVVIAADKSLPGWGPVLLTYMGLSLLLFFVTAWSVGWAGLWESISQPSLERAMNKVILQSLVLPLVLAGGIMFVIYQKPDSRLDLSMFTFDIGMFWTTSIGLLVNLFVGLRSRRCFCSHFRLVTSEADGRVRISRLLAGARPEPEMTRLTMVQSIRQQGRSQRLLLVLAVILSGLLAFRYRYRLQLIRQLEAMSSTPLYWPQWEAKYFGNYRPLLLRPDDRGALTPLIRASATYRPTSRETIRTQPSIHSKAAILEGPAARALLEINAKCFASLLMASKSKGLSLSPRGFDPITGRFLPDLSSLRLLRIKQKLALEEGDLHTVLGMSTASFRLARLLSEIPGWHGIEIAREATQSALDDLEHALSLGQLDSESLLQLRAAMDVGYPHWFGRLLEPELPRMMMLHRDPIDFLKSQGIPEWKGMTLKWRFIHFVGKWSGLADRDFSRLVSSIEYLPGPLRVGREYVRAESLGSNPDDFWFPWLRFVNMASRRDVLMRLGVETRLRAANAALEVEDFRRVNGRLPNKLEEAISGAGNAVVWDPLTGRSFDYEVRPNGYRIFSRGMKGSDLNFEPTFRVSW